VVPRVNWRSATLDLRSQGESVTAVACPAVVQCGPYLSRQQPHRVQHLLLRHSWPLQPEDEMVCPRGGRCDRLGSPRMFPATRVRSDLRRSAPRTRAAVCRPAGARRSGPSRRTATQTSFSTGVDGAAGRPCSARAARYRRIWRSSSSSRVCRGIHQASPSRAARRTAASLSAPIQIGGGRSGTGVNLASASWNPCPRR